MNEKQSSSNNLNFSTVVRESPLLLVLRIIALEVVSSILYTLVSYVDSYRQIISDAENISQSLSILLGNDVAMSSILFLVQMIITFYLFFAWYYRTYNLDDQELTVNWGVFIKRSETYILKSLEYVKYDQSFFARLFNYGHVVIKDAFMDKEIKLSYIDNPKEFTAKIEIISGKSADSFLGLMARK